MEKKRLTLTGNKMPEDVYRKLEELGNQRKLTPYIVNLIEKEAEMNTLIQHLSTLTNKVEGVEDVLQQLNEKIDGGSAQVLVPEEKQKAVVVEEVIPEGKLNVSDRVEGGIDEPIDDYDF